MHHSTHMKLFIDNYVIIYGRRFGLIFNLCAESIFLIFHSIYIYIWILFFEFIRNVLSRVYMTLAAAAALCCPKLEYYANRVRKWHHSSRCLLHVYKYSTARKLCVWCVCVCMCFLCLTHLHTHLRVYVMYLILFYVYTIYTHMRAIYWWCVYTDVVEPFWLFLRALISLVYFFVNISVRSRAYKTYWNASKLMQTSS